MKQLLLILPLMVCLSSSAVRPRKPVVELDRRNYSDWSDSQNRVRKLMDDMKQSWEKQDFWVVGALCIAVAEADTQCLNDQQRSKTILSLWQHRAFIVNDHVRRPQTFEDFCQACPEPRPQRDQGCLLL